MRKQMAEPTAEQKVKVLAQAQRIITNQDIRDVAQAVGLSVAAVRRIRDEYCSSLKIPQKL
jgi:hypothetical protein